MLARIVAAVVLVICTGLGTPVPAQNKPAGTPLSGAEMMALYSDGVIIDWQALGTKGTKGSVALVRNGFAFQIWVLSTGIGDMDKGRWRIDGDLICFKWQFSRQGAGPAATPTGEESCGRHYHVDGNRYEFQSASDGARRGEFTLRK